MPHGFVTHAVKLIAGHGGGGCPAGHLDRDDPDAAGVLDLHLDQSRGSTAGSRVTRTPAAASRAGPARTSRAWIQGMTECPGGPAACPQTSVISGPGRKTIPGSPGGP